MAKRRKKPARERSAPIEESIYGTVHALVKGRVSKPVALKLIRELLEDDREETRERAVAEATRAVSSLSTTPHSLGKVGFSTN